MSNNNQDEKLNKLKEKVAKKKRKRVVITTIIAVFVVIGLIFASVGSERGRAAKIPLQPEKNIYDEIGLLTKEQKDEIEKLEEDVEKDMYIVNVRSLGNNNISDYTNEIIDTWKVKENKKGIGVIVYSKRDNELRIQFSESIRYKYSDVLISSIMKDYEEELKNDVGLAIVKTYKRFHNIDERVQREMGIEVLETENGNTIKVLSEEEKQQKLKDENKKLEVNSNNKNQK